MNSNFTRKFEIRLVLTALILATLLVTAYTPGLPLYGEQSESVWVLRDIEDYDGAEKWKKFNREKEELHYEANYSRGSFTFKKTYTGETKSMDPYSDLVHGESTTHKAEWGSPPKRMRPGEKYPLDFYLGMVEDNSSYYSLTAWAATWFNGRKLEKSYVKLNSKNNWRPTNETLILEPPEGRAEGQKLELKLSLANTWMKTIYVYEWMKPSEASKVGDVAPYVKPEQEKSEQNTSPARELDYEVPKDENGNYIDSGIRFSNLGGEVMIRRGDDPLGWEFAQPDMVIYEGDRIKTEHDSGAVLTLKDLTAFKMKPESEVIVDTYPEKKNKIKMLAGKVWTNVKQMVTEGTMDVEMSQAVAGIKGTTFVVEETGAESILKVIDGEVELKTNEGDRLLVTGGKMATVKQGRLARFESFSINEEINSWNLSNQDWGRTEVQKTGDQGKGDQVYVTTEGDLSQLFSDDFRYNTLEGWETVHGTWELRNGNLVQSSNYSSGDFGGTYAIAGSPNWTDYSVSAQIMSKDNDRIGLVFRYLNEDNFYVLGWNNYQAWDKTDEKFLFAKVVDGKTTELVEKEMGYEEEKWYQLQVDVVGNEMSAYIDDRKIFSVVDYDLSRGKAGLYSWANEGSYFDDFRVSKVKS
ncbi:MAG: FecR family protein [Candidatus Bipolaricaulota bacterium]